MGKKVRSWSVAAVLDELTRLAALGVREISFVDDVFTMLPARLRALCDGMISLHLDLTWFCNARADQVTDEIAAAMATAGCHQVYLGFESGSDEMLRRIEKDATVAELKAGAESLRRAGIARSVGFVIGLPGETDATVAASISLAQEVRPERLQFTAWTPLPGTPLVAAQSRLPIATFHRPSEARVAEWIARCYDACPWANASW